MTFDPATWVNRHHAGGDSEGGSEASQKGLRGSMRVPFPPRPVGDIFPAHLPGLEHQLVVFDALALAIAPGCYSVPSFTRKLPPPVDSSKLEFPS